MPRPPPLKNLATGRSEHSDYQILTPRTPHSRAGQAEEALGDIELEPYDDDEHRTYHQQQSEPLLASSASASFPPSGVRNRGDDRDQASAKSNRFYPSFASFAKNIPLGLGILLSFILFVMILISFKKPEVLLQAIGEGNITIDEKGPSGSQQEEIAPPPIFYNSSDPNIISYENYTNFPLRPITYLYECNKLTHGFMTPTAYWLDHHKDVPHRNAIDEHGLPEGYRNDVCKSTITYMLGGHVGLLADLALMAQVAALARERNRTFLVDDTYWNRGNWSDHFQDVRARQPGPEPGCRAPPPEELVACPRSARHWVVTARTAKFHLGHGFHEEYENPYGHALNRLKPIFEAASSSFTETIRPNAQNAALIKNTRDELGKLAQGRDYMSVHVRRGDKPPISWKYQGKHIAISQFAEAVDNTSKRLTSQAGSPLALYLATDSPSAEDELIKSIPTDTTVLSLRSSQRPELQALASPKEYIQYEFDNLEKDERIKLTRGMIVDFAMLSGMWTWDGDVSPRAIVCTISSNICKLSAVGLGWERAFGSVNDMGEMEGETKGWVEIDNAGNIMPAWEAFQLFN